MDLSAEQRGNTTLLLISNLKLRIWKCPKLLSSKQWWCIYVRVKHQHLGHSAKVTSCHQSPLFWLVLTPDFQVLLATKYRPCSSRFWANANHAFKALCQLFQLSWGFFPQFIQQDLKTNKTFNPSNSGVFQTAIKMNFYVRCVHWGS